MGKLATILTVGGGTVGLGYLAVKAYRAIGNDEESKEQQTANAEPAKEPASTPRPAEPTQPGTKPIAKPNPGDKLYIQPVGPIYPWPNEPIYPWPDEPIWQITKPLPEPRHPKLRQRINRSTTDEQMTVRESATELLRQARRYDPKVTLDELTGARLAASEHSRGTFTELCCIVDAELNRAERKGKSLYESLTHKGTFGKQGRTRRASTRRDPKMRHLLAARAVLSGKARGVSRGAQRFFDPRAQLSAHRRWKSGKSNRRHCHPLVILERWVHGYKWSKGKGPCQLDRTRRGRTLQWVDEIPGVDPTRLMLFKPGTRKYGTFYKRARELLILRIPGIALQ